MDSVRDEVRRNLDELQVAAVDHGWNRYAEPKALANVRESVETNIMSALERVPGVVVRELEWEEVPPRSLVGWVAKTDFNMNYGVRFIRGAYEAGLYLAWPSHAPSKMLSAYDTIEAAKAACQADLAKRITSAVEPSCVTDEMVEAAWSAFVGAGEDWRDGAARRRDDLDKAALKAALTAALSSRTEEEACRKFVRDVANLSLTGEVTDEDEGTIFDPWHHDQHECLENLIRRARSLTNGGE